MTPREKEKNVHANSDPLNFERRITTACSALQHIYTRTHLGSKWHKLRVVLVIEVVEGPHILGVGDEPVDGGEVLALCQLLVQPPEHLHDTQGG